MTVESVFERAMLAADLSGIIDFDEEEWETLGDLAIAEGLEGLLYWHCIRSAVEMPSEARYILRTEYRAWATDNFAALQALQLVLDEFRHRQIEIVVLPGAPLLAFYPDPGCRPMGDIDLLVRPQQASAAAAALAAMVFTSPDRYDDLYCKGALLIDLHTDLFHCERIAARRHAGQLSVEQIWAGCWVCEVEGVEMSVPRLEDMVLYTVAHALRHSYRRLSWFADLRLLIDQDLDWSYLFAAARTCHLERPLYYGVCFLQERGPLPAPLEGWMQDRGLSKVEAWLLQRAFAGRRDGELGDVLWSFNVEGLLQRLQFLAQTYFPQPSVMLQVFPFLPKPLFPLAYGLRFGQLMFRGGRQLAGLMRKT